MANGGGGWPAFFVFSFPLQGQWVPRPFDCAQGRLLRFVQGRYDAACTMCFIMPSGPASHGLRFRFERLLREKDAVVCGVRVKGPWRNQSAAHPFAKTAKGWGTHCIGDVGEIESLGRPAYGS